ncbi:hypothetical protein FG93_05491 [Bosea sp. LC85]|uniref:hypothetical protein n=1 Tax=Bosea sp. LC85 TaxID=1502851 RepID=UPI0004E38169|nr:hypothetical protein [Bosea sp. LC85]KFC63981.1 hypothetical protein FG93_05491 [Bosea sp. LC85]
MSLSRLALRLAAIEALNPFALQSAATPIWPTGAEGRVLDSQLTPESFADEASKRLPVIAVFSDEAKTEAYGTAQDALIDGADHATLAFEIMVPAVMKLDDGGSYIVPAVALDPLAEAMLDMIDEQVRQVLTDARMSKPLCEILDTVTRVESKPWRDADLDTRLSALRVEFDCKLRKTDRRPPASAAGFDRLPEPLRSVARSLPEGSYGRGVCDVVAAALGSSAAFTQIAELRLAANMARVAGDAAPPVLDPAADPPTGDLAGSVPLITP